MTPPPKPVKEPIRPADTAPRKSIKISDMHKYKTNASSPQERKGLVHDNFVDLI